MKHALCLLLLIVTMPSLAHAYGAPMSPNPPPPADFSCAGPGDGVGGSSGRISCCNGLVRISTSTADPANCDAPSVTSGAWVCAPCGNGVCDAVWGEDQCNCPSDCQGQ
jgi:hypothetical protein